MTIKFSEVFGNIGGGGSSSSSTDYNGDWITVDHTLILEEVTAKEFIIDPAPITPSEVTVDIVGGTPQEEGVDYQISGNKFQWGELGLDGILDVGDTVRLIYFSTIV